MMVVSSCKVMKTLKYPFHLNACVPSSNNIKKEVMKKNLSEYLLSIFFRCISIRGGITVTETVFFSLTLKMSWGFPFNNLYNDIELLIPFDFSGSRSIFISESGYYRFWNVRSTLGQFI
jgi:hypothetical protein